MSRPPSLHVAALALSGCRKIQRILETLGGASLRFIRLTISVPGDVAYAIRYHSPELVKDFPFLTHPGVLLVAQSRLAAKGNEDYKVTIEMHLGDEPENQNLNLFRKE